jgi:transmembrane sensor
MNAPHSSDPRGATKPSSPVSDVPHSTLDWARESGDAERVIHDLNVLLHRRRSRRRRVALTGLAVLVVGMISFSWWRSPMGLTSAGETTAAANTILHRPSTRTLPDGSIVQLNADAAIETDFTGSRRRVTLRKGVAYFQIAKDPSRPFVVTAGGVEVRAVGTAFSVGVDVRAVEVVVTEGRVAVEKTLEANAPTATNSVASSGSAPVFGAGKRILMEIVPAAPAPAAPQVSAFSPSQIASHLAWRVPRLEFAGTPLAQALRMFSEYGGVRLSLADASLGRLQLSGILRADDTDSLLRLLEGEFGLVPDRKADEIVLRRR